MSCGCNKKRIRKRSQSHSELIENLKRGMCKITLKEKTAKIIHVYCTLAENAVPNEKSGLHRNTSTTNHDSILVWAFNKNIYNKLDPSVGWVKIPIADIDDYTYLGEVEYGDKDAV